MEMSPASWEAGTGKKDARYFMANQTSKRLLALVLAICLSLGLLLPAGQANATGSAGILTEVTGQ